jgi:hypothetical protein
MRLPSAKDAIGIVASSKKLRIHKEIVSRPAVIPLLNGIGRCAWWIDDPRLKEIHIERSFQMARETIDARITLGIAIHVGGRRREIDGTARGIDESMAKIVLVEKAVHVRTEDAA